MTKEELEALFRQAGVEVGQWTNVRPGVRREPMLVQKQREALTQVAKLLEAQIQQDQTLVASLQEQLHRLSHGGGR